jgi:hypothetical protein
MSPRGHFYLGQLGHYHFGITPPSRFRKKLDQAL